MFQRLDSFLRRQGRLLARRLGARCADVAYSTHYDLELTSVAWDPRRARRILSVLVEQGVRSRRDVLPVRPVSLARLRTVHDDSYLESLQNPEALTAILGFSPGDRRHDAFLLSHRAMVGGTLLASRRALETGRPAVNLGGGFHHAAADRGQGFCAFNDVAVAIADCRRRGFEAPVLIVDLDLHDGDGTRAIFAEDPTVHTFSVHNEDLGHPDAVASTSVALGADVDDETYLTAIDDRLPDLIGQVAPGLIYFLAGTDPARDDTLGNWDITAQGLLRRDLYVVARAAEVGAPLVYLLAGGYGQNAWRHSARNLARVLADAALEPPRTAELAIRRFRRVARTLRTTELTADPTGDSWSISERDLSPGRAATRFLGYYSRHGIELALERYGLFERLRSKGFSDLHIDLNLDDPSGQTLRVLGDGAVLIELRLRLDSRSVPGTALLGIEWLLLQDPRRIFTEDRPPLPGQKHPGLGLLGDIAALLVVVCDRLHLAGIVFVPMHYHIAAQTAPHDFHFLDPEIHGRFDALRDALGDMHLVEAIRALEEGRVVDARTRRPFEWTPSAMLLPVSEALRHRVLQPDRRRRIARARAELQLTVLPPSAAPVA